MDYINDSVSDSVWNFDRKFLKERERKGMEKEIKEFDSLCLMFPKMSEADLSDLAEDIKEHGLLCPITLDPETNKILDGYHRYQACLISGVEPIFHYFGGRPEQKVPYVMALNLKRRHLDAQQRASMVALAQDWKKTNPHGGSRKEKGKEEEESSGPSSVQERSSLAGVSERTQKKADKLARTDPELCKQVVEGRVSLDKALEKIGDRQDRKAENVFGSLAEEKKANLLLSSEEEKPDQTKGPMKALYENALSKIERLVFLNQEQERKLKEYQETIQDLEDQVKVHEEQNLMSEDDLIKRISSLEDQCRWQENKLNEINGLLHCVTIEESVEKIKSLGNL